MKAISIKQPWASLIVDGIKDIKNRTWPTKFRGRVLIHASAKQLNSKDLFFIEKVNQIPSELLYKIENNELQTGVIIGSVEIVDCVINHPSVWAEKTDGVFDINTKEFIPISTPKPIYNWVLANPIKFLTPIPAKGELSFWDYPGILAEPEEEGGKLFCHCQLPVSEKDQVRVIGHKFECRYCGGIWYK